MIAESRVEEGSRSGEEIGPKRATKRVSVPDIVKPFPFTITAFIVPVSEQQA
jgi:hypothetical protein